jgi:hypothetical protein
MSIHYKDLFESIARFGTNISPLLNEQISLGTPVEPFPIKSLWQNEQLLPERTGLYCYALPDGTVVYVGMGRIRARVWHHLRSPINLVEGDRKEQGFPKNRWAGRPDTRDFDTGEMLVTAASVTPEECTGMLEGYAIWLLKRRTEGRCLNIAD